MYFFRIDMKYIKKYVIMGHKVITNASQPAITCSKLTTEILEQDMKYVRS